MAGYNDFGGRWISFQAGRGKELLPHLHANLAYTYGEMRKDTTSLREAQISWAYKTGKGDILYAVEQACEFGFCGKQNRRVFAVCPVVAASPMRRSMALASRHSV